MALCTGREGLSVGRGRVPGASTPHLPARDKVGRETVTALGKPGPLMPATPFLYSARRMGQCGAEPDQFSGCKETEKPAKAAKGTTEERASVAKGSDGCAPTFYLSTKNKQEQVEQRTLRPSPPLAFPVKPP